MSVDKREMVTIELFLSPGCPSADSALRLMHRVIRRVPGVQGEVSSLSAEYQRARELGIFMVPAFVIEGELFSIGEPDEEKLIKRLEEIKRRKGV